MNALITCASFPTKTRNPRPSKNSAYCKKSRRVTNVDKMLPSLNGERRVMYWVVMILLAPLLIPALFGILKDDYCRQNKLGKYKKKRRRR